METKTALITGMVVGVIILGLGFFALTRNSSSQPSHSSPVTTQPMSRTLPGQTDLIKTYTKAILHTTKGDITVSFFGDKSPMTVNNFLNLAKDGFYNDTTFHRVIQDFMIQGGDPLSKESDRSRHGTGGPDYRFNDEFNDEKLIRGSLAMANSGPNTNGSQFFIVTKEETSWLDGKHTNFGHVTEGMDVVDAIEAAPADMNDNPLEAIKITSIELLP